MSIFYRWFSISCRVIVRPSVKKEAYDTAKKNAIKPDTILKNFWRNNNHFADLFNAVVFNGEQVIQPHDLFEMDTDISSVLKFNDHTETVQKILDVVKKTAYGMDFMIWGIENQSKIHYAMPLRHMLGDALIYLKEYREIASKNTKAKRWTSPDEFLSGFKKTDRLHPVISLCIYYGEDEWDGPLKLSDMLNYPENIAPYIADYPIHLIQLRKDEHLSFHNADVEHLFRLVRYIYNEDYASIQHFYQHQEISSELGLVVGTVTQTQQLIHDSLEASQKGGGFNMCKALQKLENKGRIEGIKNSIAICKELGCSQDITTEKIFNKFSLTKEETLEYVQKYW